MIIINIINIYIYQIFNVFWIMPFIHTHTHMDLHVVAEPEFELKGGQNLYKIYAFYAHHVSI